MDRPSAKWHAQKHSENVLKAIAKDRREKAFCDLEIVCGETRYQVHRVVVCSYSSVIRTACLGPWKEGTCGVYRIKDCPDVLVERMLDYIYTGDYDELSSKGPAEVGQEPPQKVAKLQSAPHTMLHAKMTKLGDMYLIEGLVQFATQRFMKLLTSETTKNILVDIIPEIYAFRSNSANGIRNGVVGFMRERLAQLPLAADVDGPMWDIMRDVPEFTRDLLKSYVDAPILGHCVNCGDEKTVPLAPLQSKCLLCRKGGALELGCKR
ncbi:uncharacterized protein CPUR_05459 [Claviceps purpurea 20.1]|uniref:BTB domain-containing protein n=1 Tax=Claviceps purpurea (strain 20.1) TaxID=1111077 RepID=M1W279_CLAP2|nr:uncharacterized protein CPUR_05459 [Claviceps purpurea 20.1]